MFDGWPGGRLTAGVNERAKRQEKYNSHSQLEHQPAGGGTLT
jgi:hypothetical protein